MLSGAGVGAAGIFADVQHPLFECIRSHLHPVVGAHLSVSFCGCHEPWARSSLVVVPGGTRINFSCEKFARPSPIMLGGDTSGCTDSHQPVMQFPRSGLKDQPRQRDDDWNQSLEHKTLSGRKLTASVTLVSG